MIKKSKTGRANINFYNCDNMEHMKSKPDNYYDISPVDPVYGIDGNSHRNNKSRGKCTKSKDYNNTLWNQPKTSGAYFIELKRISKNYFVFGGNYFPEICGTEFKTPRRNEYEKFITEHPTNWIIWDKVNSTTGFNDCELIYTSLPIKTHIFYFMWSGMMQGKSFINGSTMNPIKSKNQKRIHPTEKPKEVYKYILFNYATAGMKFFDSHGGSGSISLVCWDFKVNLDICEIGTDYFNDSWQRFEWYTREQQLF